MSLSKTCSADTPYTFEQFGALSQWARDAPPIHDILNTSPAELFLSIFQTQFPASSEENTYIYEK